MATSPKIIEQFQELGRSAKNREFRTDARAVAQNSTQTLPTQRYNHNVTSEYCLVKRELND